MSYLMEADEVIFTDEQLAAAELEEYRRAGLTKAGRDGEPVIEYGGIVYGGGVVSGHRPEMKPDGEPLERGYIALQSEGHPIQFRRVELLNLKGCMDPGARNYRSHYVEPDPAACAE